MVSNYFVSQTVSEKCAVVVKEEYDDTHGLEFFTDLVAGMRKTSVCSTNLTHLLPHIFHTHFHTLQPMCVFDDPNLFHFL
jgi:hypothetical protein